MTVVLIRNVIPKDLHNIWLLTWNLVVDETCYGDSPRDTVLRCGTKRLRITSLFLTFDRHSVSGLRINCDLLSFIFFLLTQKLLPSYTKHGVSWLRVTLIDRKSSDTLLFWHRLDYFILWLSWCQMLLENLLWNRLVMLLIFIIHFYLLVLYRVFLCRSNEFIWGILRKHRSFGGCGILRARVIVDRSKIDIVSFGWLILLENIAYRWRLTKLVWRTLFLFFCNSRFLKEICGTREVWALIYIKYFDFRSLFLLDISWLRYLMLPIVPRRIVLLDSLSDLKGWAIGSSYHSCIVTLMLALKLFDNFFVIYFDNLLWKSL